MNKLLESEGPIALLKNEVGNLLDMENDTSLECLQDRCALVRIALMEVVNNLSEKEEAEDSTSTNSESFKSLCNKVKSCRDTPHQTGYDIGWVDAINAVLAGLQNIS